MGLPAKKRPPGRVLRPVLPLSDSPPSTGGGGDPAAASQPASQPVPSPHPVVDEHLEFVLQRFRFRGARAFLWRYREHLDVVHQVVDELVSMREGEWQEIRNPGGLVRYRVRQEVGDGDVE